MVKCPFCEVFPPEHTDRCWEFQKRHGYPDPHKVSYLSKEWFTKMQDNIL